MLFEARDVANGALFGAMDGLEVTLGNQFAAADIKFAEGGPDEQKSQLKRLVAIIASLCEAIK